MVHLALVVSTNESGVKKNKKRSNATKNRQENDERETQKREKRKSRKRKSGNSKQRRASKRIEKKQNKKDNSGNKSHANKDSGIKSERTIGSALSNMHANKRPRKTVIGSWTGGQSEGIVSNSMHFEIRTFRKPMSIQLPRVQAEKKQPVASLQYKKERR